MTHVDTLQHDTMNTALLLRFGRDRRAIGVRQRDTLVGISRPSCARALQEPYRIEMDGGCTFQRFEPYTLHVGHPMRA